MSVIFCTLIKWYIHIFQTVMLTLLKKEHELSCKDNLKLFHKGKNGSDPGNVTEPK